MKLYIIIFNTILLCNSVLFTSLSFAPIGFNNQDVHARASSPSMQYLLELLDRGFVNVVEQTNSFILAKRLLDLRRWYGKELIDIDAQQSLGGATALIHAVKNNNYRLVDLLLHYGADPNKVDFAGNSPLMYAALRNNIPIGKKLVAHGARVNHSNNGGKTPLSWAVHRHGLTDFADFLIDNGAAR